MEQVTVAQGAQPSFAGVRVGVMIAGLKDGVPTARLLLRGAGRQERVDLQQNESYDLFGLGRLTVVEVTPRTRAEDLDYVTLSFEQAQ